MPLSRLVASLALVMAAALAAGSGYPGRLMADDWWIFEFGD